MRNDLIAGSYQNQGLRSNALEYCLLWFCQFQQPDHKMRSQQYTKFFLTKGKIILVSQPPKEHNAILGIYGLRTQQLHLVNINFVGSWLKEIGAGLLRKDQTRIPVSKINWQKVDAALSHQNRGHDQGSFATRLSGSSLRTR